MKKGVIGILLLLVLFVSMPLISAQTYSGFNRFTDNIKLFFSFGDNKVKVALDIREKEVDSALENVQELNNEGADKNLQQAWKKLQMIQEKVSIKTAGEVKESSKGVREEITGKENLTENFDVYVLEEEKTELTAEWVIEMNGTEGQTLETEVEVVIETEEGRIIQIENRIREIDNEISNWVVEHTYAEGTTANGEASVVVVGGLAKVVTDEVAKGDDGLKPEVKTSVTGGGEGSSVSGTNDAGDNPDETTDDAVEGGESEGDYAEGTTAEGVDDGDVSEGTTGGSNDAPESDSGESAE